MIVRLMLERVSVRVDANSEHVEVACRWAGGVQTRHALIRIVQRFDQLRGFEQMLDTIRILRQQDYSAAAIAELILPRLCEVLAGLGDYGSAMGISIVVS